MRTISTLQPTDLANAYQIEQLAHAFPWSEKVFYSNQGKHYINKKIEIDNHIVGFLICQVIADEATLFNIAINPLYQKQGHAKALLLSLIEELSSLNITTLWLEVRASNIEAIPLYQNLGFNEITIRQNYYPTEKQQREDAIIMALNFLTY